MPVPPPRVLLLVLLAVMVLAWAWCLPAAAATPAEVQEIVRLINDERIAHGLRPLILDPRLSDAAQDHCDDMAGHNFVSHTGSDGSSYWDRVSHAGYDPVLVGEVITAGQAQPAAAVQAWFGSAPHHAIILVPDATHIGVGHTERPGTTYVHYWTVDIAQPGPNYTPIAPTAPPPPPPTNTPLPTPTAPRPTAYPGPSVPPIPSITPTPFPDDILRRLQPRLFLPAISRH